MLRRRARPAQCSRALGALCGVPAFGQTAHLTNDTHIPMSAARTGTTIVTRNERDFSRPAKFRQFSWSIASL